MNLSSINYSTCVFETSAKEKILTLDCVPIIFTSLVTWLILFAGIVAVIFIIFGGIKFITSGGDPKRTEGARKTITWSIIGLILIFMSFGIVRFIASVTGVDCINEFGFDSCKNSNSNSAPPRGGTKPPGGGGGGNTPPGGGDLGTKCSTYRSCSNGNACVKNKCVSCSNANTPWGSKCGDNGKVCIDKKCQFPD